MQGSSQCLRTLLQENDLEISFEYEERNPFVDLLKNILHTNKECNQELTDEDITNFVLNGTGNEFKSKCLFRSASADNIDFDKIDDDRSYSLIISKWKIETNDNLIILMRHMAEESQIFRRSEQNTLLLHSISEIIADFLTTSPSLLNQRKFREYIEKIDIINNWFIKFYGNTEQVAQELRSDCLTIPLEALNNLADKRTDLQSENRADSVLEIKKIEKLVNMLRNLLSKIGRLTYYRHIVSQGNREEDRSDDSRLGRLVMSLMNNCVNVFRSSSIREIQNISEESPNSKNLQKVTNTIYNFVNKIGKRAFDLRNECGSGIRKTVFLEYLKWKMNNWAEESRNESLNTFADTPNLLLKTKMNDLFRRSCMLIKCKICLKEVSLDVLLRHSEYCMKKFKLKEDLEKRRHEISKFNLSANENKRNNLLAKRIEMNLIMKQKDALKLDVNEEDIQSSGDNHESQNMNIPSFDSSPNSKRRFFLDHDPIARKKKSLTTKFPEEHEIILKGEFSNYEGGDENKGFIYKERLKKISLTKVETEVDSPGLKTPLLLITASDPALDELESNIGLSTPKILLNDREEMTKMINFRTLVLNELGNDKKVDSLMVEEQDQENCLTDDLMSIDENYDNSSEFNPDKTSISPSLKPKRKSRKVEMKTSTFKYRGSTNNRIQLKIKKRDLFRHQLDIIKRKRKIKNLHMLIQINEIISRTSVYVLRADDSIKAFLKINSVIQSLSELKSEIKLKDDSTVEQLKNFILSLTEYNTVLEHILETQKLLENQYFNKIQGTSAEIGSLKFSSPQMLDSTGKELISDPQDSSKKSSQKNLKNIGKSEPHEFNKLIYRNNLLTGLNIPHGNGPLSSQTTDSRKNVFLFDEIGDTKQRSSNHISGNHRIDHAIKLTHKIKTDINLSYKTRKHVGNSMNEITSGSNILNIPLNQLQDDTVSIEEEASNKERSPEENKLRKNMDKLDFVTVNSGYSKQRRGSISEVGKKKCVQVLSPLRKDRRKKSLKMNAMASNENLNNMLSENRSSIFGTPKNKPQTLLYKSTTMIISNNPTPHDSQEEVNNLLYPIERYQKVSKTSIMDELINCSDEEEELTFVRGYYSDNTLQQRRTENYDDGTPQVGIQDFIFIKKLGQGAFGKVFLVKRKNTDDFYAMKVINFLDNMNKNKLASLEIESHVYELLTGEYVVKALFKFTHQTFVCFVMEYMYGGDFGKLLSTFSALEEHVARFYIAELILAVEQLHAIGIIHRDLKPENLLLDSSGHLKLTDFGLSEVDVISLNQKSVSPLKEKFYKKFFDSVSFNSANCEINVQLVGSKSKSLADKNRDKSWSHGYGSGGDLNAAIRISDSTPKISEKGSIKKKRIVGTPDYIAPEIINGTGTKSSSCDWWSVGVILFEFIVGIPPFNDDTVEKIFDNILNLRIPWDDLEIGNEEDQMTPEAADLIQKLLILDPSRRIGRHCVDDIKAHPFFDGIDWENLRRTTPPFIPQGEIEENLPQGEEKEKIRDLFGMDDPDNNFEAEKAKKFLQSNSNFTNVRFDLLHIENQKMAELAEGKTKIEDPLYKKRDSTKRMSYLPKIGDPIFDGPTDLCTKSIMK